MATLTDRDGNTITAADGASVERYDAAIDSLLHFSDDIEDRWEATVADEPGFVMGNVGRAYLACISSERPPALAAREILDGIGDLDRFDDRERRHIAAARAYANGDLVGAREALARLSIDSPRDVLALAIGHQLDFFTGDAMTLRDRIARAIHAWDRSDPRYAALLGMLAFGLEECGLYPQSEATGLDALERDELDVWAHHAVLHTYEMQGRVEDGMKLADTRRPSWSTGNVFVVHNTWHEALFHLDVGNLDRVLELYDATIHNDDSPPVAIEMLDASAMLWRLFLDGIDTGGRWAKLADAWAAMDPEPWYAFNDAHAVMAYVGAGRLDDAHAVIDRLAAYVLEADSDQANGQATNVMMTRDVGLPVCSAFVAFGEERYDDVVDLLFPIRTYVQRFGGSHAQRDAEARTILEAAIRGGNHDLAAALLSERLTVRPSSGYARAQLARIS